jgi:orotidine-5'-phosphate decarboxylase
VLEKLKKLGEENKTILCFGIDPLIEKINIDGTIEEKIISYYSELIDALLEEHAIAAIKPNYAYFAQYGFDGLSALKNIINSYKNKTFIILDGKRGDIGKSSEAYAREIYDFWKADATTVSPYMGSDSVKPFLREGKIVYVLCRTSNEGAKDFQELKIGKKFLYEHVAKKAVEWNVGLVIGATSNAIKRIVKITKEKVPFLIPGIGAQGGDLLMVMEAIKTNPYVHRINVSSSLAYAYEKTGEKPKDATLNEAEKLNKKIREFL